MIFCYIIHYSPTSPPPPHFDERKHHLTCVCFGYCTARHATLPKQPAAWIFIVSFTAQFPRNGMHHTAIMKHDEIPFFPSMRIQVLRAIHGLEEAVYFAADLGQVIHDGHGAGGWISSVEFVDAAAEHLELRLAVARVFPNHLCACGSALS